MESNYSLSDLAAVTGADGLGGNNIVTLLLLFALFNGGLFGARSGELNQYATAASQQEILFGQQFQNLNASINKVGDGISSLGYSQLQQMTNDTASINGNIVNEGRSLQSQLADCCCTTNRNIDSVRFDMANYHADTNAVVTAQTQKILDAMAQNKIDALQAEVNTLKTQNMFCGVPKINPYGYGVYQYSNGCGCNCGNI